MKSKNDDVKNNKIKLTEQAVKKAIRITQQKQQQITIVKNIEREIALNADTTNSVCELILLADDLEKHKIDRALSVK